MELASSITTVGQAIQLSVAPVFLLAGVGALLAVLTNRLARIIDRVHFLERELPENAGEALRARHLKAARPLSRRARLIHWAISLCTTCELLVCVVVATLFIGAELGVDLSSAIALLFISAMLTLIAGLICFLREIALATALIESLDKTFVADEKA
ncbi:MAG: hypothetical protein QG638_2304 [Pseudomonadota bacterium]|nr:hypothetical protein [Pseudomonadota bacterium]